MKDAGKCSLCTLLCIAMLSTCAACGQEKPIQMDVPTATPVHTTAAATPAETSAPTITATITPTQKPAKATTKPKATAAPKEKTKQDYLAMVPHFSADEEERLRQKWEISVKGKYYNHPDLNYYYERMLGITDITNYDKELYSDTKVLDMDFLRKCPKEVLHLGRNTYYAVHGRMFDNKDIFYHFLGKMWYEPKYTPKEYDEKIGTKVLNDVEKENLKRIRQVEKEKGY